LFHSCREYFDWYPPVRCKSHLSTSPDLVDFTHHLHICTFSSVHRLMIRRLLFSENRFNIMYRFPMLKHCSVSFVLSLVKPCEAFVRLGRPSGLRGAPPLPLRLLHRLHTHPPLSLHFVIISDPHNHATPTHPKGRYRSTGSREKTRDQNSQKS